MFFLENFDVFGLPWRFRPLPVRPGDKAQNLETPGLSGRAGSYEHNEVHNNFCSDNNVQ